MSENTTTTERDQHGRFQSGNRMSVGHGRPRGSRALLSDVFLDDLREAWERDGASALKRVAADDPGTFLKVVASIMPKQVDASLSLVADAASFAEAFKLAAEAIGADAVPRVSRRRLLELEAERE